MAGSIATTICMSDLLVFLREKGVLVGSNAMKRKLADLGQLVTEFNRFTARENFYFCRCVY
jgi:hypothetical protein